MTGQLRGCEQKREHALIVKTEFEKNQADNNLDFFNWWREYKKCCDFVKYLCISVFM